jgi:hypothetical protein
VAVTDAITSPAPGRAAARAPLGHLRGGIENRPQGVRGVAFDEDRAQTRTGAAP